MGIGRRVEVGTPGAAVAAASNGNGHGRLVELTPFMPEPVRHVPLRTLPEGMNVVADVTPQSLLSRLSHIGARKIPADAQLPERYSFDDGTHFELGSHGPVFVQEGFGPYGKPQRFDLHEAAVRETIDHTGEKVKSQLEFVFPFDELLQGHAGVTVITITPHSRVIQRINAKDYASLPDREKEIIDIGRILHNEQNRRRNQGRRREIK